VKENRKGKSNLSINLLQLKLSVVDDINIKSIMSVSGNKFQPYFFIMKRED
jgi:hypothetical protein